MLFVGLDAHQGLYVLAIFDPRAGSVKRHRVRGTITDLTRQLVRDLDGRPCRICFEASCDYGVLHDRLAPIAERVIVAHPGKLRLIYRDKRKNDKTDAEKLAKLLYADMVPEVHVPSLDARSWRRTIEHRTRLVHKRTRTKNAIRALLRGCGVDQRPPVKDLWSAPGRRWLQDLELPTDGDALHRDVLVEELASFDRLINRVTTHLDAIARDHPAVRLLQTITGVGPRTAEAVTAYVDQPHRFRRVKQIGAYFGLVPCQDQSGSTNRLGHVTRQGPATVRGLLVEAAWWGVRRDPTLRAYYERRLGERGDRKKIAIVATAHYLARVMLTMLKTGEPWRVATTP